MVLSKYFLLQKSCLEHFAAKKPGELEPCKELPNRVTTSFTRLRNDVGSSGGHRGRSHTASLLPSSRSCSATLLPSGACRKYHCQLQGFHHSSYPISIGKYTLIFFTRLPPETFGLTSLFLRPRLAPIHHDTAPSCAVLAQEYSDDAHDIATATSQLERSPNVFPLSSTAPTPDPRLTPPHGEGHPSALSTPEYPCVQPVVLLRDRHVTAWSGVPTYERLSASVPMTPTGGA